MSNENALDSTEPVHEPIADVSVTESRAPATTRVVDVRRCAISWPMASHTTLRPAAPLTIAPLRENDLAFVRQLSTNAFGEFSANPGRNTVWMAEHHRGWVAWQQQRRLGFALLDTANEVFELTAIAVVPGERGKGTGQALLAAVERATRAWGASELRARTADANVAALSLFLRNGYRVRQRLPRYYANMYAACELVKTVPSALRASGGAA